MLGRSTFTGMKKKNLYWLCQILAWTSYGVLEIFLYSTANKLDASKVIGEVFLVLFYIASSHGLREIIIKFGLIRFRWFQVLPRLVFFILFLSGINFFFLQMVSFSTGQFVASTEFGLVSIIVNVSVSAALYFVWSLIYLSFLYIERFNKSLQYQAIAKEIELSNLKSQLNPHFIFNALNSIRALVDEEPKKSKEAITQLSNILRNSLSTDSKRLVPFRDEIGTVMDYLELESIRYEERLSKKIEIDPKSDKFQLPPLMLQTLVENGIKHGIATLKEGGIIGIKTVVSEEKLRIEIRNTGQYKNGRHLGVGYGLLNTKKRLNLIYGDKCYFQITNENKTTVLTTVEIPEGQDLTQIR